MTRHDKLELISPTGEVTFYTLDPGKGITNIGRHPDNDIVIESPSIAPFHAVLDHRRKPYHVVLLSEEGETRLDGRHLPPNVSQSLAAFSSLEVDGFQLILVEGIGGPPAQPAAAGAAAPVVAPAPPPAPDPAPPTSVAPARPAPAAIPAPPRPEAVREPAPQQGPQLSTRPLDQPDEFIVAEMEEREWTVDVEQSASFSLTVINGGPYVASFTIDVEGVDRSWVEIHPPQVNLNEGERREIQIAITPPREPSSRAGAHHLAVRITSANYPGRATSLGATLIVNPYYEFAVGELDPKEQTLGWRRSSGEVMIHLLNKGNSEADVRLDAVDDQRALSFEFAVPGETSSLARQADVRLTPEETYAVPVKITALSRPIVGLRRKRHPFTVTATMLEGSLTPRSLLGHVKVRPLIGPLLLLLLVALLSLLIILIFRPKIHSFGYLHPREAVNPGDPVTLSWDASPFTRLRIEEEWIESGGGRTILIDRGEQQTVVNPEQDTRYTLVGGNLLSDLLSFLKLERDILLETDASDGIIDVVPLRARITRFAADQEAIVSGESVVLTWTIVNADEAVLEVNGTERPLFPEEHQATQAYQPLNDTTYTLKARNRFNGTGEWDDQQTIEIYVNAPTPTPLPSPVIIRFDVAPRTLYAGESVTITWQVESAKLVQIFGGPSPEESNTLAGYTVQTLNQVGTIPYRLIAIYDDATGEQEPNRLESTPILVSVLEEPTPTPEPEAPVIADFQVVPSEVALGETAQLVWTINGTIDTMDIAYSSQDNIIYTSPDATGSFPAPQINTEGIHTYILTAHNGDISASQTAILTVNPPPTPAPTPLPPPSIALFEAAGQRPADQVERVDELANSITYQVDPGTLVRVYWTVLDASTVTLFRDGVSMGDRPLEGEYNDPVPIITQPVVYRLDAENAEGTITNHYIEITPLDLQPPPPPYDVDGVMSGSELTVTWDYDLAHWGYDEDDVYPIIGFSVYRAVPPSTEYVVVADENDLDETTREWTETSGVVCGYSYYVTAVYLDRYGDRQESEPSPERYYSEPCPTPTP